MIQLLRGLAEKILQDNPVLGEGQPCVELDTGQMKIGNGTDNWDSLPYVGGDTLKTN